MFHRFARLFSGFRLNYRGYYRCVSVFISGRDSDYC